MKIIAPLDNFTEIGTLINAGADEFYCGVIDAGWRRKFPKAISPNRRIAFSCNLRSFDELRRVVKIAHGAKKKIQFCLNGNIYIPELKEEVKKAIDCGVDRIIVSDIAALLDALSCSKNPDLFCISSGATVLNKEAAGFFKKLGIKMIVLPRDLTLQEIKSITEANDSIKFEVFVKNESCANIGGFCTFTHTAYEKQEIFPFKQLVYLLGKISGNRIFSGSIKGKNKKIIRNALRDFFHSGIIKPCNLNYSVTVESEREADNRKQESEGIKRYFKAGNFLQDACGGCALVDFLSMNIYGVKIVGRGHDTGIKLKDILFVKKSLLTAAGGSLTPVEKKEAIKENFVEIFGYPCSSECYYP